MTRLVTRRYDDPLELVWLACAERLGMRVERSAEVYASWDGASVLTLSTADDFDADDSLAQLIYHEICHSLVAGPRGRALADWGMSNTDDSDLVYEHACHRVQAALAAPFGLREFFAVTTDWRPYWDALPENPLQNGDDPAIPLAQEAYRRSQLEPVCSALTAALELTAQLAALLRQVSRRDDSLWNVVRPRHRSGLLMGQGAGGNCGDCAWSYGGSRPRCRRSHVDPEQRARVRADWVGCESFETRFDDDECRRCAACCREGYDRVELRRNDAVKRRLPQLISRDGSVEYLARPQGKCVALVGERRSYSCEIYEFRPKACSDLEPAGDACLTARRRAGVTK